MHHVRGGYPFGKHFFKHLDKIGNGHLYNWLVTIAAVLLIIIKRYVEAIWVFISSMLLSLGAVNILKNYFQRPRPKIHHKGFSFPSGHATSSMIFYGILAIIVFYIIKNQAVRFAVQVVLIALIAVIGLSRVYLGVHYPSDILAGYSLSLAWILFTFPLFKKLQTVFHEPI
ncbi:phosphatase PAP2 family protein [Periweissella fabalis]|uniref:Phosphatase PAP2 family protein n=1 Tax=Periweissella fabalis TaxID=1070421 RepID=A0A7X6S3C9_9LACO|nr:phosphatase PAP2 family protein [Periweissella fabalis]MCM0599879.1 phosphatase PAP2 family protein [Periweissella fabalis]NKZ24066.1 phosphatase PAP2 family protein [Periweissella fabalis]